MEAHSYLHRGDYVFSIGDWFVCLSVCNITQKGTDCNEIPQRGPGVVKGCSGCILVAMQITLLTVQSENWAITQQIMSGFG